MSTDTNIGIIGCGNISDIYCKNIQRFRNLNAIAVADLDLGCESESRRIRHR